MDTFNLTIKDEVGALVFDIGHYSIRAGFAGEDSLKAEIPSMVGYLDEVPDSNQMEIDSQPPQPLPSAQRKYFIDTTSIHVPRKGVEMTTFLKDGMSKSNSNRMVKTVMLKRKVLEIRIGRNANKLFKLSCP